MLIITLGGFFFCLIEGWPEIQSADQVWYFFSRRGDNKRVKRTTGKGFWKVTGKSRKVKGKKGCAAKKSLVFYEGRAANAKWTPWVIHEYTFTSTFPDNKVYSFSAYFISRLPSSFCVFNGGQ